IKYACLSDMIFLLIYEYMRLQLNKRARALSKSKLKRDFNFNNMQNLKHKTIQEPISVSTD
ncbi:MAG: hypothetical protein ACK559_09735, partial [bacterium]